MMQELGVCLCFLSDVFRSALTCTTYVSLSLIRRATEAESPPVVRTLIFQEIFPEHYRWLIFSE